MNSWLLVLVFTYSKYDSMSYHFIVLMDSEVRNSFRYNGILVSLSSVMFLSSWEDTED